MQILYYDQDNCLVTEQASYAAYGYLSYAGNKKKENSKAMEALIIRCIYGGYVVVTERDKAWCERAVERLFDSGKLDLRSVPTQVIRENTTN